MSFLRNYWYIAAASSAVGRAPHPFKLLGEHWVAFRDSRRVAAVVEDRCCHRQAPLSLGRVRGDAVQCPYHGWEFDGTGRCVRAPGMEFQGRVPPGACVRALPVVERHGFIWAFLGDPTLADPSALPEIPELSDSRFDPAQITLRVACNYRLSIENLLTSTHFNFVHQGIVARDDGLKGGASITTEQSSPEHLRFHYRVERHIPTLVQRLTGWVTRPQAYDQYADYRAPDFMRIVDFDLHDGRDCSVLYFWSVPEDEGTTRQEILQLRTILNSRWLRPLNRLALHRLFRQDARVMEGQQRVIDREPRGEPRPEVSEPLDAALLRFRKLHRGLIARQQNTPGPAEQE